MVLWYFWIYSFLGYLLERAFAAVTHAEHQGRRCFLLLPLCPVYGLGMLAVLALPPDWTKIYSMNEIRNRKARNIKQTRN